MATALRPIKNEANAAKALAVVATLTNSLKAEDVATVIGAAMQATTTQWETNEEGKKEPITVADHRLRMEAAKLYLAYVVGMPVQRQEIITKEVKSEEATLDAILASPAALAALESRISEAKARQAIGAGLVSGKS